MPVQIGANAHSVSDPTGPLSDCHRRIEMFHLTISGRTLNHLCRLRGLLLDESFAAA